MAQTQRHKSIRTGLVYTHAKRAAVQSNQQLCTIFSNENAQTTNRTPQKKLTRLKRHEILDGVGKGGSREGRVWEEEGSAESRGREEILGMSREGSPGQGGPGKGRSREEGQGRGPQTHGPNWPKGASFRGLGFRFLGSLVLENHKAAKTLPFPFP